MADQAECPSCHRELVCPDCGKDVTYLVCSQTVRLTDLGAIPGHKDGDRPCLVGGYTAFVYMVECSDGSLYTGWAKCWKKRIDQHNKGVGAKYMRSRLPVRLAYLETVDSRSRALQREAEIKKLSRKQKLKMVEEFRRTR